MSKRKKTTAPQKDTSKPEETLPDVSHLEKELLRANIRDLEEKLRHAHEANKQAWDKVRELELRQAVVRIEVTDEETIARMQLQKLKDKVLSGGTLSLEEVKIYDLLVKNKRLAQGDATTIPGTKILPEGTPRRELLKLAAVKDVDVTDE